jgi:phosphohistidine phosphatase
MDLVLWRHAEAVEREGDADDLQRGLTPRGERQAVRMAAWLDRHLPEGARIWVSPALRTQQTVVPLGRKFKTAPSVAPDLGVDALLTQVQWPHGKGCHVVVGHQPTVGLTLARLLGGGAEEFAVKKGAVWWLRLREREFGPQVAVISVQSPDML